MWMERQIQAADFVLIVCTETYLTRVERREHAGRGRGALWEGILIYNEIYLFAFRVILWMAGVAPLNYVRFLESAADRLSSAGLAADSFSFIAWSWSTSLHWPSEAARGDHAASGGLL